MPTATSSRSAGCKRGTLTARRRRDCGARRDGSARGGAGERARGDAGAGGGGAGDARTQVDDVETMLREVTATMQAEIVRSSDAQRAHDEAAAAAALQLAEAEREISQLRAAVEAAREAREGAEAQLTRGDWRRRCGASRRRCGCLPVEAIVTSHPDLSRRRPSCYSRLWRRWRAGRRQRRAHGGGVGVARGVGGADGGSHGRGLKLAGGGVGGGGGGGGGRRMGSAAMHGGSRRRRCSGAGSRCA